ncbi:MAG: hypothetical protein AYK22_03275 [Thermoplasmatales archaeon SG8-52-3]|nr:MAG: hypothetical protein AYK22_03275 [Thermoplasmatales archaeon SG8-52-3]
MFYKDWEPIYKKISREFNYTYEREKNSAEILNNLLNDKQLFPIKQLEKIIINKEIVIFGAGPSLENSIEKYKKKIINFVKITADGATSALLKKNILPDIIVTDFDGYMPDQIKANLNGCIVIIHAHGDNISSIKKYVKEFKKNIIGTTHIDPSSFENIYNFGGFTDGDRAVFLSSHFKAKKINLIGFDFDGKIGMFSYPEKKDLNMKLKKLFWCFFFGFFFFFF